jgi:aspartyl-tRNA(Asn)/glutamyl-tRNA(Gln) amidotransferase subunit B
MNNLKVTIGIEIHLELLTKTKMFSSSPNTFGKKPNTQVNEIDMGYPGSMPTVNKQAVIFAIKLAKALNMTIDSELSFDRKHYYYPDLPKGYQITQQTRPIGKEGTLLINNNVVKIERIHMEEDTAKQVHKGDTTYLDFNRAGIPLIEIVTHPAIHSAEQAVAYVKTIQLLAKELGISDAKMENGSLRTDVNISLSSSSTLGTKVEIKNMNSFNNIKTAIKNEIEEQTQNIINSKEIQMTTKRFDEKTKTNIVMRSKTNDIDYKYFKEPNIAPITLSKEFIDSVSIPTLP